MVKYLPKVTQLVEALRINPQELSYLGWRGWLSGRLPREKTFQLRSEGKEGLAGQESEEWSQQGEEGSGVAGAERVGRDPRRTRVAAGHPVFRRHLDRGSELSHC